MVEILSKSFGQTETIGERLSKSLKGTETIALFGDLGAGKTTFVKGLCKGLNVIENICSPTFTIVNEYVGKYKIYHFDMYRVQTVDDLYSTGYFDYLNNGILIIEWSENIEKLLPQNAIKIFISYGKNENERIFKIYNNSIKVGKLN